MSRKVIKRIMVSICIAAMLIAGNIKSFAASSGDVDVDRAGKKLSINAVKDKDLFQDMKEMMPGDTRENTVGINNASSQAVTFYLLAYPDYEASGEHGAARADGQGKVVTETDAYGENKNFQEDLLDIINMRLEVDGRLIYEGTASGRNNTNPDYEALITNHGIRLANVPAKGSSELKITITLPAEKMTNKYANAFGAVDWTFIAEGEGDKPIDPDDPHNPTKPNRPNRPDGPDDVGGNEYTSSGGGGGGFTTIQTIEDPGVPLAGIGPNPEDVTILIYDEDVPLAGLAKTGGAVLYLKQIALIVLILLVGLFITDRARKHSKKN